MKKYYYDEHETAYRQMKQRQIKAWDEYHEPADYSYDNFMMRAFLEEAVRRIEIGADRPAAFEYGCGTGAGACFLAEKGFAVDAVDISPTAIEMAKQFSAAKGLRIGFKVQDVLELSALNKNYDVVLDNYCLQSIVTDEDRSRLYSIVLSGLNDTGYYIVSTAIYNEGREYGGDSYYCGKTGIAYEKICDPEQYGDAVLIDGEWWLPNRRHLTEAALREELQKAGFAIRYQDGGNLICQKGS